MIRVWTDPPDSNAGALCCGPPATGFHRLNTPVGVRPGRRLRCCIHVRTNAAVLVGALALALELADAGGLWVAVAAAGAGGAVMSVWTRMQSKQLQVDIDAGPLDLLVGGVLRPLVGALSALGIYVFVEAGIVPLDVPEEPHGAQLLSGGYRIPRGIQRAIGGRCFWPRSGVRLHGLARGQLTSLGHPGQSGGSLSPLASC